MIKTQLNKGTRYTTINVPNVGEFPIDVYIDVVWDNFSAPFRVGNSRRISNCDYAIKKRQISEISDNYTKNKSVNENELRTLLNWMMYFSEETYRKHEKK